MKTLLKNFTGKFLSFAITILIINNELQAQVGTVIWQENFNNLDTSIWNIDTGDGCNIGLCGWGNAELEYYNRSNVYIADVPGESGNKALVLEARNQSMGTRAFTSGKVNTSGKLSIKYGLVEVRVRVPNLQTGLWPAVWMLGTSTSSWPAKGEIDIMEMGHNLAERTRQGFPNSGVNNFAGSNLIFYSSTACSGSNPTCAASTAWDVNYDNPYVPNTAMNDRFLIYRMYWSSSSVRFTVTDNGTETDLYASPFSITSESSEFQNPFYFILNLAVGGNFTDATTNSQVTAPLPGKMYIDYVKVSKWNNEGEVTLGSPAENGTFGVYTDNTPTTNKLVTGTSSDVYAWSSNLTTGNIAPYEGSNVIAWSTTTANAWFGGGVISRQARNMTNYSKGNLKFKIKIPADVNFMAGFTEPKGNHWVAFPANTTAYGLTRDGNWGQVTIPISAFGNVDLSQIAYMFAINTLDGASLPASTFQFAIDDIIWEEGTTIPSLPSPWSTADIGTVGTTGSASYLNGTFTVNGSGADIWDTADAFRFVYQTLSGDGEIIANVNSIVNTNAWAKAGVMIRESLNSNSTHAMTVITPSNGIAFQSRSTTGGTSANTSVSGQTVPKWVKIKRAGNIFSSYYSSDGSTWAQIGASSTISMSSSIYVGMCVTSHSNGTLCKASFSNVQVTQGTTQSCTVAASTGDFTVTASNSATNPTLTFIPSRSGVGSPTCILYYNTSATGTFPGYNVTPNVPYQINATSGQTVYFYYTYSLPQGGENNTSATKNSFTVGNCSTLKSSFLNLSETVASDDVQVWPNPAKNKLFLKFGLDTKQIQVISTTGNILLNFKTNAEPSTQIDISNYKPGLYFIKFIGDSTIMKKIIKE
jgi:beta-glucanase (GH16 family)